MRTRSLALAASLATLCSLAHAGRYDFALTGYGVFAAGGVEGCSPPDFNQPGCPRDVTWNGLLSFQTDGSADGVYTGDALEWMTFSSNFLAFTTDGNGANSALPYPPSVTLVDGAVASLHVAYYDAPWPIDGFLVDGFNVHYVNQEGGHAFSIDVSGVLTPVPEPGAPALLALGLSGLAGFAGLARGRRLRPAPAGPAPRRIRRPGA